MIAHNARALALLLGHGAMLISLSQSGTQTVQRMRQREVAPEIVTNMHQTISWMSVGVAVFLLAAFFSLSDEPKPYQKGLLGLSLAAFLIELAIACRVWLI